MDKAFEMFAAIGYATVTLLSGVGAYTIWRLIYKSYRQMEDDMKAGEIERIQALNIQRNRSQLVFGNPNDR